MLVKMLAIKESNSKQ